MLLAEDERAFIADHQVEQGNRRTRHRKRGFGLRRTRLRRLPGATIWVGLGIFAYNLQRMTVVAAG